MAIPAKGISAPAECSQAAIVWKLVSGTFHLGAVTVASLTCILPMQKFLGLHIKLEQGTYLT